MCENKKFKWITGKVKEGFAKKSVRLKCLAVTVSLICAQLISADMKTWQLSSDN